MSSVAAPEHGRQASLTSATINSLRHRRGSGGSNNSSMQFITTDQAALASEKLLEFRGEAGNKSNLLLVVGLVSLISVTVITKYEEIGRLLRKSEDFLPAVKALLWVVSSVSLAWAVYINRTINDAETYDARVCKALGLKEYTAEFTE